MKKALVLAGGGTRGAYQDGAVKALLEMGEMQFDMIVGTSIGALNAVMLVQRDYEAMHQLYDTLNQDMIYHGVSVNLKLETLINERNLLPSYFRSYVKEKGVDNSPFCAQVHRLYDPVRFQQSDIDFGCIAVTHLSLEPVYVTKEMMKEDGEDWLISTASCFPAFPPHRFKNQEFVDGGYFDNLPIDYALRMGADEIYAIDLNDDPQHPNFMNRNHIHYQYPQVTTGSFLDFDRASIDCLRVLGYNETLKTFGRADGVKYTFKKMASPAWWDRYYLDTLELETRIRLATAVSERLRTKSLITDRLLAQQHKQVINEREFCFGMMDNLMSLCGMDIKEIYEYSEARNYVLAQFAETANEDYKLTPGIDLREIAAYVKTLDQKGIVAKLVHQNLYPSHMLFPENIVLTVYPFEQAMANFVTAMMKALGEEYGTSSEF